MSDSEEKSVGEEEELPKAPAKKNKNRKRKSKQKATPQKKAKVDSPKTPAIAPKDSSDESMGDADAPKAKVTSSEKVPDAPEGSILELGRSCHVRTNTFNGTTYLDFRVFYKPKDSNELRPGNKGISLTVEQWDILKKNISMVDKAFAAARK